MEDQSISREALPAFHQGPVVAKGILYRSRGRALLDSDMDTFLDLLRQAKEFGDVEM